MKFLFIVTSYWAIGEMEIAVQFANDLKDENDIRFLCPRCHEAYLKEKGFDTYLLYFKIGKLNRVILQNIEYNFSPDYIILSDYLNYVFCENHYGLNMDNLNCFHGKIGAFDLYNQSLQPRCMDTYGFKSKKFFIDKEKMDFLLLPCPLLDKDFSDYNNNIFAVPLINNITTRSDSDKKAAKAELGIDESRKMLLVTNAQWQSTYKKYDIAVKFVEEADRVFYEILGELSEKYDVVIIGKEKDKDSKIKYMQSVPPSLFEKYINATDLFISRNIISTSFAKIILRGIPGVVLINSDNQNHCYRCKMFPVGWYDYISSLEEKSLYFKLFEQIDMFEKSNCISTIEEILRKEKLSKEFDNYLDKISKLMKPSDVFKYLERNNHNNGKIRRNNSDQQSE